MPGYKVRPLTVIGGHLIMDLRPGLFLTILLSFVLSVRCQSTGTNGQKSPSGHIVPRDDKDTMIVFRNMNENMNLNLNDDETIERQLQSYRRTISAIDRKRGGRGSRKETDSSNQNVNVNKNYNVNN